MTGVPVPVQPGAGLYQHLDTNRLHVHYGDAYFSLKVNGQLTGKGQIALVNQPNTFDKLNTFADITCTSLDVVSDENTKNSIVTWLPGDLDQRLLGLDVCQFYYENSRERQRLGLTAQNVAKYFPECTNQSKTIDYVAVIVMLLRHVQDLTKRVQDLEELVG